MSGDHKTVSLCDAMKFAWSGIVTTFRNERNFKIEVVVALLALGISVLLALEPVEWAIIIVMIVLVLALELANSALEGIGDLVSPDIHPLAKFAKDSMAGAVLVAAGGSVVVGLIIYVNAGLRLWSL